MRAGRQGRQRYFNPRPPCGGRPVRRVSLRWKKISIHAPRAGGDNLLHRICPRPQISIHAPRAGGDTCLVSSALIQKEFQSTPPVRGATRFAVVRPCFGIIFQSTPPVRGATAKALLPGRTGPISIHAPRAGGDTRWPLSRASMGNFNPRPPCGGRRVRARNRIWRRNFNPRPPCGGRHLWHVLDEVAAVISIHAPRAGGDICGMYLMRLRQLFQSTPPVRGATFVACT